jgi:hypothetical protein
MPLEMGPRFMSTELKDLRASWQHRIGETQGEARGEALSASPPWYRVVVCLCAAFVWLHTSRHKTQWHHNPGMAAQGGGTHPRRLLVSPC